MWMVKDKTVVCSNNWSGCKCFMTNGSMIWLRNLHKVGDSRLKGGRHFERKSHVPLITITVAPFFIPVNNDNVTVSHRAQYKNPEGCHLSKCQAAKDTNMKTGDILLRKIILLMSSGSFLGSHIKLPAKTRLILDWYYCLDRIRSISSTLKSPLYLDRQRCTSHCSSG